MKKYTKYILVMSVISVVFAANVYAVNPPNQDDGGGRAGDDGGGRTAVNLKIENPFKCSGSESQCGSLINLFKTIVEKVLLPIGGVAAVVSFIWSGFLFVTAQGEPAKIQTAKNALLYTAIGTAVLLGAVAIATIIDNTISALQT
ncbi:pilin [Candidatus Parcubacteria bacterium]|nr:pilin [Candidatus Parcubacteria bacterium]